MIDDATLLDLLVREYFELQKVVEGYNQQFLVIKGWSVSIGIAALIAAYARPVAQSGGRRAVVLAALVAIPFYLTDALWKSFQSASLDRVGALERFMACAPANPIGPECPAPAPLQIAGDWGSAYGDGAALFAEALTNWAVILPHGFLLVVGLFLALAFPPRAESGGRSGPRRLA